ncbi:hypothetical protein STVIR_5821 [Streptomyces viridochromogenes Tue57]|uniref:Uncharacterized protein n=1 Tax=Streptomyces viridochromogenes Tue57 TaxID=1160705 RepID=L8P9Y5_STRVR|nr:hypothetical protein STVIR_5821 [Streptomyces viridochromogenes Tue57]
MWLTSWVLPEPDWSGGFRRPEDFIRRETHGRAACIVTAADERPKRRSGVVIAQVADDRPVVVGVAGFEPTAFRSQSGRATKLRHTPCWCDT